MKNRSPFLKHLAFFDRNHDGIITFGESLRGNLSLGLNFPVSLFMAVGQQLIYGNTGPLKVYIKVDDVRSGRTMLEQLNRSEMEKHQSYTRTELAALVRDRGIIDRVHVHGLWALSADLTGNVTSQDLMAYQDGNLLEILEQRRKTRCPSNDNVLSFWRGGPGNATGHSYVVKKLFDVDVYGHQSR